MLSLYAAFPDDFTTDTPLFVEIDSLWVPLWHSRFERRGQSGAVAAFDDFDTERRALELIGREFCIELTDEQDDEFYMEDLVGFAVQATVNGQKKVLRGVLTDYIDSDANPLFEAEFDGRRVLIPAVEEFIAQIAFERRTIKFVLPEGLLELE